ncbi:uncharacterized protein LOC135489272 isoform X2 [Lineus longissimus]
MTHTLSAIATKDSRWYGFQGEGLHVDATNLVRNCNRRFLNEPQDDQMKGSSSQHCTRATGSRASRTRDTRTQGQGTQKTMLQSAGPLQMEIDGCREDPTTQPGSTIRAMVDVTLKRFWMTKESNTYMSLTDTGRRPRVEWIQWIEWLCRGIAMCRSDEPQLSKRCLDRTIQGEPSLRSERELVCCGDGLDTEMSVILINYNDNPTPKGLSGLRESTDIEP